MKNKVAGTLSLLTAAAILTANGQIAAAAAGGVVKTEGTVTIKQQAVPTKPANPVDPAKTDPNDPGVGKGQIGVGSNGLFLDYVSNFNFSEVTINPAEENTVYASPDQWSYKDTKKTPENIPNHLQISDQRLTKGTWNVKVSASEMTSTDPKSKNKLAGAAIVLKKITVKDSKGKDDAALKSIVTKAGDEVSIPTTDAAILVMRAADAADARGTFFANFDEKDPTKGVALKIPKQNNTINDGEQFKTQLKWTLSDAPL